MSNQILIVDDEAPIREMIKHVLDIEGYLSIEAKDASEAYEIIVDRNPDLVLLDWMLPEMTGVELIRRLKRNSHIESPPVIMLTAKSKEENKLQCFQEGVDDYITKPFSPKELIARVTAVLRRSGRILHEAVVSVDKLSLDTYAHRVFIENEALSLGPTDYKLLLFFMTHPERAYTRGQLLDQVWGGNVYIEERTVDVHIRRLRKALVSSTGVNCGHLIQTVRGTGYRFSAHSEMFNEVAD